MITVVYDCARRNISIGIVFTFVDPNQRFKRVILNDFAHRMPSSKLTSAELNYEFGAALYEVKHPEAKAYHKLSQPNKKRFRAAFQRRGESKFDSMKKHRIAWDAYQKLLVAAEATKKLAAVTETLERRTSWS